MSGRVYGEFGLRVGTVGIERYLWNVLFETFKGALVICRRHLDWNM